MRPFDQHGLEYGPRYVAGPCEGITQGIVGQSNLARIDPRECAGERKARSLTRRQRGEVPAHVPDRKRFGSRPEAPPPLQNHRATPRALDTQMTAEQRR